MGEKLAGKNNPFYGKKHSESTRKKMRENHWSKKGNSSWCKGLTKDTYERLKIQSEKIKAQYKNGRKPVWKGKKNIPFTSKGKNWNLNESQKKKISERQIGKNNPNWKDGITKLKLLIRTNKKYFQWRADVFKRDNYHCQECGEKGYLEAHHIIPFSILLRELGIKNIINAIECSELWDVGNGISYCKTCHSKNDKLRHIGVCNNNNDIKI